MPTLLQPTRAVRCEAQSAIAVMLSERRCQLGATVAAIRGASAFSTTDGHAMISRFPALPEAEIIASTTALHISRG
jgi:hypothetical protein